MSTEFFNDQWRIPSNENQNKISNYSMEFDGTSTDIDLGSDVLFDSTESFSVSAWVNLKNYSPAYPSIIRLVTDQTQDFIIGLSNQANYAGVFFGSNSQFIKLRTTGNISGDFIGTWKHVCVTFDGVDRTALSSYKVYVDGSTVGLTTAGNFNNPTGNINTIGNGGFSNRFFNGKIDQVSIFDYELSQDQVIQLGAESYAFNFIPNDYIDLGTPFSFTQNLTVSLWVKSTQTATNTFIGKDVNVSGGRNWMVMLYQNKVYFWTTTTGNISNLFDIQSNVAGGVSDGEWHHIVCVNNYTDSTKQIYIDGVLDKTNNEGSAISNSSSEVQIGKRSSGSPYDGEMSNVALWNTALTGPQVTTLYNNGNPGDISSLNPTAWYKLDDTATFNSGTSVWTIPDASTNSNNGTSVGMDASNLVASNINGELIANPMITSPKPIAYYQLGDQSVDNGANYLVPNNSLQDYVFDFIPNDFIDCGDNDIFSFTNGTGTDLPFSLSAWVYMHDATGFRVISKYSTDNASPIEWFLYTTGSGILRFRLYDNASGATIGKGYSVAMTNFENQWINIVGTYNANELNSGLKIYINGSRVDDQDAGTGTGYVGMSNTNNPVRIGRMGTSYADGEFSNVSIFNTELSQAQVEAIYNNGTPNDISSLNPIAWYKLNASEVFNSTSTEWSIDNNAYPSVYKSSLNFDGNNDYIDCGDSNTFTFGNGTTDSPFSISAWINMDDATQFRIASKAGSNGNEYFLTNGGDDKLNFILYDTDSGGAGDIRAKYDTALTSYQGQWIHVVGTYSGVNKQNGLELYLNGNPLTTLKVLNTPYTAMNNTTQPFEIGRSASSSYSNGKVSNVSVFNTELTSTQVETLYNNGTPEVSISHSPVSWWKLDNTTTGLIDNGSASNNGTNNGATEYAGFVNSIAGESSGMDSSNLVQSNLQHTSGYSPYALSLDGTSNFLTLNNASNPQINPTLLGGTTSFTVSAWIKPSTNTYNSILGNYGGGQNVRSFWFFIYNVSNARRLFFRLRDTNANQIQASTSNDVITFDSWQHVSVTYDELNLKIFVNGVEKADTPSSEITINTSIYADTIGSDDQIGGNFFNGEISNVAVWRNSVINPVTLYNNGVPANLNNLSTKPSYWWQMGSNSSFNASTGKWTCLNEGTEGTISMPLNATTSATNSMTNDDITNGVGYSASGLGTSSIDIVGDAPYSSANGLSENMDVLDRTLDTPIVNTHSIQLDGVDGAYVDFGNVNIFERTDAFSGSCWINLASSASTGMFISKSKNSTIVGYQFYVTATRDIIFFIGDFYSNNYLLARTVNPINASTWYNVAFTYSGSSARTGIKLYVNGVAQSLSYQGPTSITGSIVDSSVPFQISGRDGANLVLDGKIDEVAMFNSELSAPQVASIYNNGTPNNILPLNPVSWHRFESLTTNSGVVTTADSSVNGLTGTVENGAVLSTIVP